MRRVKITKQQTVNPKAVYMGLSIPQIITMAAGIVLALGIVALFIFRYCARARYRSALYFCIGRTR